MDHSEYSVQKRSFSSILAGVLSAAGLLLFVSISAGRNPSSGLLFLFTAPGRFLFSSFLQAGYYVPVYLLLCGILLFLRSLKKGLVLMLTLSLVPFLTVSVILRITFLPADLPVSRFFISAFGPGGSVVVLVLLLALEAVGMVLLGYRGYQDRFKGKDPVTPASEFFDPEDVEELDPLEEDEDGRFKLRLLEKPPVAIFDSPDEIVREEAVQEEVVQEEPGKDIRREQPEPGLYDSPGFLARIDVEDAEFQEVPEALETPEGEETGNHRKRDVSGEQKAVMPSLKPGYFVPPDSLLTEYPDGRYWEIDGETEHSAEVLKKTLEEFKIRADVTGIQKGPVITMFEILPAPGVKLAKITNLADNIALRLAASSVRIVAPIPGKHAVGIEVPNKKRSIVSFKEMVQDDAFDAEELDLPIILGKDISGNAQIVDLTQTPHVLIAGATGSGKSVCVNSIICSILFARSPEEARLLLIDPKIVELKFYNDIPHLLTPVITDPKKAFQALQYCLYEMERRYSLLDALGVRDVRSYNQKIKKKKMATEPLPYIIIIVDEFADLMATSGKELESTLARLAAMSRAIGIHLVLATQRPSIDVITGLIKANIPSRIAFMVAGKFDSRIIIDGVGAEKLLGKGDMLFTSAWNPVPTRIQGAFLSEEEVEFVTDYIKTLGEPEYIDDEIFFDDDDDETGSPFEERGSDPLMEKALDIVISAGKASASYLQRRLKIGYNRAARIVEEMEERGIVGPQQGSKPREIIHVPDWYK